MWLLTSFQVNSSNVELAASLESPRELKNDLKRQCFQLTDQRHVIRLKLDRSPLGLRFLAPPIWRGSLAMEIAKVVKCMRNAIYSSKYSGLGLGYSTLYPIFPVCIIVLLHSVPFKYIYKGFFPPLSESHTVKYPRGQDLLFGRHSGTQHAFTGLNEGLGHLRGQSRMQCRGQICTKTART